uniref:Uncharacterized protein n=1 Tax=Glossina pallidipes TaxID=7398 RepID=A0A1A9ZQZ1_GLOPL
MAVAYKPLKISKSALDIEANIGNRAHAVAVIVKVLQLYCNNGKCDYFDLITSYTTTCSQCFISFGSCRIPALSYLDKYFEALTEYCFVQRAIAVIQVTPNSVLIQKQAATINPAASDVWTALIKSHHKQNLNVIESISVSKILQLNSNKNGYESAQF